MSVPLQTSQHIDATKPLRPSPEGHAGSNLDLAAVIVVAIGFVWRLWLAHATFFNTDEAWHYSAANQGSLLAAYRASLTLAHPPLLIFIIYFWRHLGTSDAMLRLPCVLAGSVFCWIFYKWLTILLGRTVAWCGLIFAIFLPPMIALSAELRQYTLMLMFAVIAAYLFERSLADNSATMMLLCFVSLYLAMLSHYSTFLIGAALGIYAILRMLAHRPALAVTISWVGGEVGAAELAWLVYATHISKLGDVYRGAQPLHRFGDFYLADWYFHPGQDHILPFFYRSSFGVFRFMFGQTGIGQLATLLFLCAIAILLFGKTRSTAFPPPRSTAAFLACPFLLNWIAVVAGLYPYGRTRQCAFLAIFGLAGVSVSVGKVARNRLPLAGAFALGLVVFCQIFGTLQGRDMLPLKEQRHEHMDQAVQFIRSHVAPKDEMFTDKATSFQLRHYLCRNSVVSVARAPDGTESFLCDGLRIVSTGSNDGALSPRTVVARWQDRTQYHGWTQPNQIWVLQAGWASGLGEALRQQSPAFAQLEIYSFGRYIEAFELPHQ